MVVLFKSEKSGLKGNRVRIPDSTRCCIFRYCHPLFVTGINPGRRGPDRNKSENLPCVNIDCTPGFGFILLHALDGYDCRQGNACCGSCGKMKDV